jgi:hypothetical protein
VQLGKGALLVTVFAAAGIGYTALALKEEAQAMEGQHWVMLFIAVAVGYVLGRMWLQPAQMLGLP